MIILRDGERGEHCPVANVKFLEDVVKMHLDGTIRNIQPAPDFLVRQPFGHQTHDLTLPVCQRRQSFVRDCALLSKGRPAGRGRRQKSLTISNFPQDLHQSIGVNIRWDDGVSACRSKRPQVAIFDGWRKKHQSGSSSVFRAELGQRRNTRHQHIYDGDVRNKSTNRIETARAVAAMCNNLEVMLRFKHAPQTLQNHGMPVCDNDACTTHIVFAFVANAQYQPRSRLEYNRWFGHNLAYIERYIGKSVN
jgi:hypothetical protein